MTIEMDIEMSGSLRADYLYTQIDRVYPKLRQYVEYGCAKGGLMLKPYVSGKDILVDFVQADQFYPISFDANGKITACVFSDTRIIGKNYFTRLEYHQMTSAGCQVTNVVYKADGPNTLGRLDSLQSVADWANLEPDALIDLQQPVWQGAAFTAFLLGASEIGDVELPEPYQPVRILSATPITATEAAWVRLKGADAMRDAWRQDGVDVLDQRRRAAEPS